MIPRYSLRDIKFHPQMVCSESFETIVVTAMITSVKNVHVRSNTLLGRMRECCQNGNLVGCKF